MASRGRGSKSKGSNFELKIAKQLTTWWGATFHRVPGSGSLHWGSDNRVAGDIVPPQGLDFPFVVECKKHEGWTLDNVLLNTGEPKTWWAQVVTDSRRVKQVPMLIFSRNRAKEYVMVPYSEDLYKMLTDTQKDPTMRTQITFEDIREEEQYFDVLVTTLDALSKVDPNVLRAYAKEVQWDRYAEFYQ